MKINWNIYEVRPGKYSVYSNGPAFIVYTAFDSRDKMAQIELVDKAELAKHHVIVTNCTLNGSTNSMDNRKSFVQYLMNYETNSYTSILN